jgi:hypothetical protein
MNNFWVSFAIGTILTFLKSALTNPAQAVPLKHILLEIRNDINLLFPGE